MTTDRYPLAPLAQALGIELLDAGTFGSDCEPRGVLELAARFDCSPETIYRFRRDGLSVMQADRYAMGAGVHPSRIWPTWWADVSEANREHAELGCVCDDDGDECTCGYYSEDPPMGSLDLGLAA